MNSSMLKIVMIILFKRKNHYKVGKYKVNILLVQDLLKESIKIVLGCLLAKIIMKSMSIKCKMIKLILKDQEGSNQTNI